MTILSSPRVPSAHAGPSIRPPDVDHLAAAAPNQLGGRRLPAPVSAKGGAAPRGARSRGGNRRGPCAPRAPAAPGHQHPTPGTGPQGGERSTCKPRRPHAPGTAALGGGLRPAERGGAPTPNRDRVRGAATPATPGTRHRPASFRTPRGRVGTLVPHNPTTENATQQRGTLPNNGERYPTTENATQRRTIPHNAERHPTTANTTPQRRTLRNNGPRCPTTVK